MAVSIEDAWNVSSIVEPQVQLSKTHDDVNMNSVSAKQTYSHSLSEQEKELRYNVMLNSQETPKENHITQHDKYMESIIIQLQELRKEESKRFTVYITISGILFALLFMYIERLQNKIEGLSHNLRHVQVMKKPPSHDMRSPPSELYSWLQQ